MNDVHPTVTQLFYLNTVAMWSDKSESIQTDYANSVIQFFGIVNAI